MQRKNPRLQDIYLKQFEFELEELCPANTLKKRMLAQGYAVEKGGLCAGIAGMGMQNWLLLQYYKLNIVSIGV